MTIAPDILLVLATLVSALAIAAALSAWADRFFPTVALAALAAGIGVFVYAFNVIPEPDGWREVPNAFISVLARIMN